MPAIFHQKTLFQTPKATPRQCKWTRQTLKGHRRTFKDFRRDHRTYLQMKDSLHTYSEHISKLALSRVPSCFSCFSVLHFVAWSCVVLSCHASLDPNVLSGAITRLCCIADLHSLRHGSKVLTERRGCKSVDWAVASFQWKSLKFAQERCTGTSIGWCNDGWGIATLEASVRSERPHQPYEVMMTGLLRIPRIGMASHRQIAPDEFKHLFMMMLLMPYDAFLFL